jgi:hypothetical protein
MSNAAKMDILELLHAEVAKTLRDALKDEPSPQMLAQAIKFLKDNGVEPARDADNAALKALSDEIDQIASSGDADAFRDIIN